MVPTDSDASRLLPARYPKFNAWIYALETFVPPVKLGVGDQWRPDAQAGREIRFGNRLQKILSFRRGGLLRVFFCAHIIFGWVLTTLWVGGFTGLIKS